MFGVYALTMLSKICLQNIAVFVTVQLAGFVVLNLCMSEEGEYYGFILKSKIIFMCLSFCMCKEWSTLI